MPSEVEKVIHDLMERLKVASILQQDKVEPSPSERKWMEIAAIVETKGWSRPFAALSSMTPADRENIRQTLCFNWARETLACTDAKKRAELESWEIIHCNIRGVAARLHSITEQLSPTYYMTWRGALTRILEMLNRHYKATEPESGLEKMVHDALSSDRRIGERQQTEIPIGAAGKVGKPGGIVIAVLKDVTALWDDVLGSEDTPAVATVYAICEHLHPKRSSPAAQGTLRDKAAPRP